MLCSFTELRPSFIPPFLVFLFFHLEKRFLLMLPTYSILYSGHLHPPVREAKPIIPIHMGSLEKKKSAINTGEFLWFTRQVYRHFKTLLHSPTSPFVSFVFILSTCISFDKSNARNLRFINRQPPLCYTSLKSQERAPLFQASLTALFTLCNYFHTWFDNDFLETSCSPRSLGSSLTLHT